MPSCYVIIPVDSKGIFPPLHLCSRAHQGYREQTHQTMFVLYVGVWIVMVKECSGAESEV